MNLRSASPIGPGLNRRACFACAASAVWLWTVLCQTALGQSGDAELAPLPPPRPEASSEFAPKLRVSPGDDPTFVRNGAKSENLPEELGVREPERVASPDAVQFPADPSALRSSRFFRQAEQRYQGPGQPLIQESWNFRPFSFAVIYGFVQGGTLKSDWIRENQGVFGGFQFGWDCDNYWGVETRFTWAELEVVDSDRAIAAQVAKDDAAGVPENSSFRHRFDARRHNHRFFWDAHALYYPWGDSAWRPFLLVGLGAGSVKFIDRTDVWYQDTLFTVPIGLGFKYRVGDFMALRVECVDYMCFGGGKSLDLLHDVTVLGGLEIRYGGPRRAYWPWNPGRHYW